MAQGITELRQKRTFILEEEHKLDIKNDSKDSKQKAKLTWRW